MTKHSINPEDTDGGITAAAIEKETETPDYWRECAKGLHATVVKLQDAEEVLRARTEKAEQERDEYRRSLERWRESAIRGRKERDEAKKFAGLWKEATREAIRDAKHVQDLYAASLDGMEQRLRDTETDLGEESNNYLHARRQLEDAAKTIRELRGQLVEQETRGFTAEDVTEEMVDRAHRSLISHHGYGLVTRSQVRDALTDALTEPERPEWADLAGVLGDLDVSALVDTDDLARQAHARGVRVVTEEQQ